MLICFPGVQKSGSVLMSEIPANVMAGMIADVS